MDELNPSYSAREISPAVENHFAEAFTNAFKIVFESRGIYQNVKVNTDFVNKLYSKHQPQELIAEFEKRPFVIVGAIRQRLGVGVRPVGRSIHEDDRQFSFAMPVPELYCNKCKRVAPYILESEPLSVTITGRPNGEKRHQCVCVSFLCSVCNSQVLFLVSRVGFRVQLWGRSTPYRPRLGNEWPQLIVEIVQDALQSVGEGDINAGYYHLRTGQEFYLKDKCSFDVATEIKGVDLCSQYNAQINPEIVKSFPSMAELYKTLSYGLHTRQTTAEGFDACLNNFSQHLRAVQLYESLDRPSTDSAAE